MYIEASLIRFEKNSKANRTCKRERTKDNHRMKYKYNSYQDICALVSHTAHTHTYTRIRNKFINCE